jgi:hypothetical protein
MAASEPPIYVVKVAAPLRLNAHLSTSLFGNDNHRAPAAD